MTLFTSLRHYRAQHGVTSPEQGALALLDEAVEARLELQKVLLGTASHFEQSLAPIRAILRVSSNAFVFKNLLDAPERTAEAVADALTQNRFVTHPVVSPTIIRMIEPGISRAQTCDYTVFAENGSNARLDVITWVMDLRHNMILGPHIDGIVAVTVSRASLDDENTQESSFKVLVAQQAKLLGLGREETLRQLRDLHEAQEEAIARSSRA